MTQIIEIIAENKNYQIEWALSEYFGELKGKKFMINKMLQNKLKGLMIYHILQKYYCQQLQEL
jgi:hypothetical protein